MNQHDRDSAELRRLCQERDNLKATCRELRAQVQLELERHRTTWTQLEQAKRETEVLRKAAEQVSSDLCKASDWICREVETGTRSATHWAIRLNEGAAHLRDAMQGVSHA